MNALAPFFSRASTSFGFALLAFAAGCGGSPSNATPGSDTVSAGGRASDGTYVAPAGCKVTRCQADAESCTDALSSHCAACNAECSGVDVSVLAECAQTCSSICDDPEGAQACADAETACEKTKSNLICTDAPATTTAPPPDDAGAASPVADAGSDASTAANGDDAGEPASSCAPHDPSPLTVPFDPTRTLDACSSDEIETLAMACGTDSSSAACARALREVDTTCARCAFTPATSASPGAYLVDDSGITYLNQGGCSVLVDPTCGDSLMAYVACEQLSCGGVDTYCGSYVPPGRCDSGPASTTCFISDSLGDEPLAERILDMMCGSGFVP